MSNSVWIPGVELLMRNLVKDAKGDGGLGGKVLHERIGKRGAARAAGILAMWCKRDQKVWKMIVVPKRALELDDLAHLARPFIVCEAPLAPNGKNERISRNRRVVDAIVAAHKQ